MKLKSGLIVYNCVTKSLLTRTGRQGYNTNPALINWIAIITIIIMAQLWVLLGLSVALCTGNFVCFYFLVAHFCDFAGGNIYGDGGVHLDNILYQQHNQSRVVACIVIL